MRMSGTVMWAPGAFVVLVVLLAGSVKVDANLTVRPNDQIDGIIVMAVDREFAAAVNTSPEALLDQVRKSTFQSPPSGGRLEAYSDDR